MRPFVMDRLWMDYGEIENRFYGIAGDRCSGSEGSC